MNEVCVRAAVAADANDVYRLLRIIADLHRDGRPDVFTGLISKYTVDEVEARLSNEDSGVLVADVDGAVAGYVFCDIIKEGSGKTLYVDDLCVNPEMRHMGIGKRLMDAAADYGRRYECSQLMLNVWEFNHNAVDFYEKYGLKTRSRHMDMPL